MENSYKSLNDDSNLQIIRHPLYGNKSSTIWFDIRVFYVRISNFTVDDSTPEYLTLNHIPLSHETILELNGSRCPIQSDGASCILRRDRVDKKSEEVTFVSTDSIRSTGGLKFEVFDKLNLFLSGNLENLETKDSKSNARGWSMSCESVKSVGTGFLKGKKVKSSEKILPMIEVYIAGCYGGTPIILTKSLQISPRKKHSKKVMLDSIPEYESSESQKNEGFRHDMQVVDYRNYKAEGEEEYNNVSGSHSPTPYWGRSEYMESEDGELSWFNAGVRVGVGLGLGICVGVGVGVGLLVRTYQATTKTFKRRIV